MFSFFVLFSQSIFIPYSKTDTCTVRRVNASLLGELSPGFQTSIAVAVKPSDKRAKIIEQNFIDMATYYDGKANFFLLEPISADKLATDSGVNMPCIFVYKAGLKLGSYPYPDTDGAFCFLLKILLEKMPKPVTNQTELFHELGNTPFTFISPPEKYNKALSLQYDCSSQMGSIGIVVVEPQVLLSLGFNVSALCLFRTEDKYIVRAIERPEGLYEQSYPVFRKLMASDLRGPYTKVFALIAPALTDEYIDFLFEVGYANPAFVVGFLPKNLHSYAESICHKVFNDSTVAVVAFNYDNGFYYPTSSEFPEDIFSQPFNAFKWVTRANSLLRKILLEEITPEFLSEPEPTEPVTSNAQMLVGTTYEQFVMDPEHDVVVLYKREGCENCVEFFPEYLAFAQEFANETHLKFGYIDIVKNSAKKPYPYMPGVPHVHIFPAKNKTNDQPLRGGRSRDALLRLIKTSGSFEYPFEAPPMDKASVAMELFQLLFSAKDMPPEEQQKAMEYVKSMNDIVSQQDANAEPTPEPTPEPDLTSEL